MIRKLFLMFIVFGVFLNAGVGFCGQESRGGSPFKDRFRRIGHFLIHHLENNQVRLSNRLSDFKKFKKTVNQVPIKVVDAFPEEVIKKIKENLVAVTVDDAESPVGKTILLHYDRFKAALNEFDGGRETTVTIVGDINLVIKKIEQQRSSLIELSFLSFCFHEFLLAAKEEDSKTQLSSLLSVNRDSFIKWMKENAALKDNELEISLSDFRGPVLTVLENEDVSERNRAALKAYIVEYEKTGRALENKEIKDLTDTLSKKVPVLKTKIISPSPTLGSLIFLNRGEKDIQAATFYTIQKKMKFYLDTDQKIKTISLEGIQGPSFVYQEFPAIISDNYPNEPSLTLDRTALIEAEEKARLGAIKLWKERKNELEEMYRKLHGDNFILLSAEMRFVRTGFGRSTYTDPRSGRSWIVTPRFRGPDGFAKDGQPNVRITYYIYPILYVFEE